MDINSLSCSLIVAVTGREGMAMAGPWFAIRINCHPQPVCSHPIYLSLQTRPGIIFSPPKLPPIQTLSGSFGLTNFKKIWFNLQMNVTFSLFACPGFNVLCCFRSTHMAEDPEIISPPANTTIEPLERPIMQFAPDLPTSVTTTQIPGELPSASGLGQARYS